jgi:hypothetical protein
MLVRQSPLRVRRPRSPILDSPQRSIKAAIFSVRSFALATVRAQGRHHDSGLLNHQNFYSPRTTICPLDPPRQPLAMSSLPRQPPGRTPSCLPHRPPTPSRLSSSSRPPTHPVVPLGPDLARRTTYPDRARSATVVDRSGSRLAGRLSPATAVVRGMDWLPTS